MNLHFDSINFSAMISALCRKGNLLEATLRRGTGVQQVRQTNEKRLSSIIREMWVRAATTCVPKLRNGNLAVARNAKTEYTCNECAFISFRSYVIARGIVACYGLIKIPAINSTLNCGNNRRYTWIRSWFFCV